VVRDASREARGRRAAVLVGEKMQRRLFTRISTVLLLVVGLVACGSSDEDRLTQADKLLGEAREGVRSARDDVQAKVQGVETAQADLETAREALAAAEQELVDAEGQVDLKATDALLFRAIQRKLLEDDQLENLAIRAQVDKGVVTLYGSVPDGETNEAALEIVRGFPGVVAAESQLEVGSVASPGP
jgi:osmotically-inducible protein OsmY